MTDLLGLHTYTSPLIKVTLRIQGQTKHLCLHIFMLPMIAETEQNFANLFAPFFLSPLTTLLCTCICVPTSE